MKSGRGPAEQGCIFHARVAARNRHPRHTEVVNHMKDRYVNLFTDFGFKKIFGEELNKDLLKDFLNQLLKVAESLIRQGDDDDRIVRTAGLSLEEILRSRSIRS